MPRMVDASGFPIYAQLAGSTIVTPLNAPAGTGASSLIAATDAVTSTFASMLSAATATATPTGKSQAEIVKDQQAIQAGLDNTTPRNILLVLGSLLALVTILSHPRFLARLFASFPRRKKSAEQTTYVFHVVPYSATPGKNQDRPVGGGDLTAGWVLRSGQAKAINNADAVSHKSTDPLTSPAVKNSTESPSMNPPPHITPLHKHIPYASRLLYAPLSKWSQPFASAANMIQLYIILGYLIFIGFALAWRSDITPATATKGYGSDFMRSGLVAVAHFPIVIALGVRGNLVGLCIGKGYEKLKLLHKITGRVLFLAASLHVIFYLHKFAKAGTFVKMMSKPFILAGFLSWIAIVVIAFTSIPYFRNAFYGFFKICHILGMMGLLTGMCFHVDMAIPWCTAAFAIYAVSLICSLTKTRFAHAEFQVLEGSKMTLITIPSLRTGWRAGQHVRIRIPAMGVINGVHGHPFTIASAPDGEGMVLMCKAAGNWTRHLFQFANTPPHSAGSSGSEQPDKVSATVILEGPYGGLGNTMLPSYSGTMLVAGGSGITHALALAHDLITRAPTGAVRARTVDLIWSVRTEEAAKPLFPTLLDLVNDARKFEERCIERYRTGEDLPSPVALRIRVHLTRAPTATPLMLLSQPTFAENPVLSSVEDEKDDILEDRPSGSGLKRQPSAAEREKADYLARTHVDVESVPTPISPTSAQTVLSALIVEKGVPDYSIALNGIVDEILDRSQRTRVDPSGVCVTACGPRGLVASVRTAVIKLEAWKRQAVGGMELEEERFGF